MSRIGNLPIDIPADVSVSLSGDEVTVKGPKGQLSQKIPSKIKFKYENNLLTFASQDESRETRALHGLIRSLLANIVVGVKEGYQKQLELVGTGYRVSKEGDKLVLSLGFSHPVEVKAKEGISLEIEGNNKIIISGIDKQKVGQTAAEIRSLKKPEPYKGKGIRYVGEIVHRKPGKAAKVGAAGAE